MLHEKENEIRLLKSDVEHLEHEFKSQNTEIKTLTEIKAELEMKLKDLSVKY